MLCARLLVIAAVCLPACFGATFGTVVPLQGGATDIVLDEGRSRLYLVNSAFSRVEVYSLPQRRFLNPINTDRQPISAALSQDGARLYVTSYEGTALDIVDPDRGALVQSVSLPARPEGVAVGGDGRVLITTIGTGATNATNTLLVYDPQAVDTKAISNVVLAPPPPTPPQLPPPSGRVFQSGRSQLIATRSGDRIVGLNLSGNSRVVFVYEVSSGTVLRSRTVSGVSTVLSVAPDGSKFMAGLNLFDTATLAILAQQNAANAPFPFSTAASANFNVQQNQGGSVFAPDGSVLYTAFNIAPDENPPARPNVSRLLLNDPENLLIKLGLELPENLAGKTIVSSDGSAIYALSESGFLTIPIGQMYQQPIAMPDGQVVLLNNDQCGVMAASGKARVAVNNWGAGRMRPNAQLYQMPTTGPQGIGGIGGAGGGAPGGGIIVILPSPTPTDPGTTRPGVPVTVPAVPGTNLNAPQQQSAVAASAPRVAMAQTPDGAAFDFSFNPAAARSMGTLAPPHTFLIQAPEAINVPSAIRVYQNNRNSEARADLIPVQMGSAILEGLVDIVSDAARQRLYIANSGMNRVEVFDMQARAFLDPIRVGQLPRSLALAPDGNTLYAANTGGESISIVDLSKGVQTGYVKFPPIPFNASAGVVSPAVIAAGQSGLQIVMNNGTLWQVIGDTAVPRRASPAIGTDSSGRPNTIPSPWTMASSPNGESILLLSGNGYGYLYDASVDEYVVARQIFTRPGATAAGPTISGLYGAVAAGPRGQYFLANGVILNQSLTVTNQGAGAAAARPVAAVAPIGPTMFVRFTQPVRTSNNAPLTEPPVIELVDVNTGATMRSAQAVEGPLQTTTGPNSQMIAVNGRTMTVDPAGNAVYVLTSTGLSIVPLDAPPRRDAPTISAKGIVNLASYQTAVAPGQLISVFGQNLGTSALADSAPLPAVLGGVCLTAGDRPLPLLMTSPGQINAQIPPELAAGRYTVVLRSVDQKLASGAYSLTVSKYAPAVLVDPVSGQAAIFHADGRLVTKDHPATRDERLTIWGTGLGVTTGGKVVSGMPAPSDPLADVDGVQVFFGRTDYRQSEMIVEWSGLAPGFIGLNQINVRVPGDRMHGDDLPVTIRVNGVDSPSAGPVVAKVSVH